MEFRVSKVSYKKELKKTMKLFETFEHLADIGIRGRGQTLEEAFSNILKALASLLIEEVFLEALELKCEVEIEVSAEFLDELLVSYINKVLTYTYLEGILFFEFKGKIDLQEGGYFLRGFIYGTKFEPQKFGYGVEVKGATFTLAKVEKENHFWVAQCVVDV
ncbi:MAG: archease [Thermodesulfobacteriaceae bacterium]|nr:archease [Thermodesulfobacteriaceae bacterium]MCX8041893.1 archease [Thermodesulfobacteriaceae bacterium]MDW8135375.1 archease [Thermodesulfobacterium sp.]